MYNKLAPFMHVPGIFLSTLVPGSGSFQLSGLAGLVYGLGLGFWVVFTIIVSIMLTLNLNHNRNRNLTLSPILTTNSS